MISQIPQQGKAFQFYNNLFDKLNQQAEQLDESLLDARQDSTDVYVKGETSSMEGDTMLTTLQKELTRDDASLSYREREQKTSFQPFGLGPKIERSVSFDKTKAGDYHITHLSDMGGASWSFSPEKGTISEA